MCIYITKPVYTYISIYMHYMMEKILDEITELALT